MAQIQLLTDDRKVSKKNYYFMIFEGALFWFATSFIDGNAVISVFIHEATGSVQLAGLTAALRSCATYVGQFVMGIMMWRVASVDGAMHKITACARPMLLLCVPLLLLGVSGMAAAISVMVLLTAFYFSDGLSSLLWQELSARTIEPRRRTGVQGYQMAIGGAAAFGSAMIVKLILDSPAFTFATRYALIFGMCGAVFVVNFFFLLQIKDLPSNKAKPVPPRRKIPLPEYFRNFVVLWKADGNYRRLMLTRVLYVLAISTSSLIVLFGMSSGGITAQQASSMLYLQVAGQVVGGLVWAQIGKHLGNNAIIIGSQAIPVVVAGIGIAVHFAGASGGTFFVPVAIMVFLSSMNVGSMMGYNNRVIDIVEPKDRTGYLVMQGVIQFPFTFGAYLAGLAADLWDYLPVFAATLLIGAAGLVIAIRLYIGRNKVAAKVELAQQQE